MKISELITKLEVMKDQHGDANLYVRQKYPYENGRPALNQIGGHSRFDVTYEDGRTEKILWLWARDDENESNRPYIQVNE